MKILLKIYRFYFNFLAIAAPKYGGKVAFKLFQKVTLKTFRTKELPFYKKAKHFNVKLKGEDLHCYELGNPKGKLVFLVHGWNSNAGSLSKIAEALANKNYRVISFDLPAHAFAKEKRTDLYICKEAFKKLIIFINPQEPFCVVSHSFGSIVSSYALSQITYKTDKFVILSTNNKLEDVFKYYKRLLVFNDIIYNEFKKIVKKQLQEDISEMITSNKLKLIDYNKLLLIHDKFDKVIPFSEAEEIYQSVKNAVLIPFEKIGHYRMLWNEDVIKETVQFLNS